MRRSGFMRLLPLALCLWTLSAALAQDAKPATIDQPTTATARVLRVTGPWMGLVSLPVFRLMDLQEREKAPYRIEYVSWRDPNQLRAIVAGDRADFVCLHSQTAANFHNRGVTLRMLNVSLWGIFWIMDGVPGFPDLESLKGREIVIPLKRGELPDMVFRNCALGAGMNPDKDFQLRYVATAQEAVQSLLLGRADHAVLPEPLGSIALLKSADGKDGRRLTRGADLQTAWGRAYNREARIPVAGVAVSPTIASDPEAVAWFEARYAEALEWCRERPDEAGELAHRLFPDYPAKAVADSVRVSQFKAVPALEAREDLEFLFKILMEDDPDKIGGRMVPDGFYWQAPDKQPLPRP
jgi:NitT/TauT family transport system substrate-binding protein